MAGEISLLGSSLEFDTSFCGKSSQVALDSKTTFVTWDGDSRDCYVRCFDISSPTYTPVPLGTGALRLDASGGDKNKCLLIEPGKVLTIYKYLTPTTGKLKARVISYDASFQCSFADGGLEGEGTDIAVVSSQNYADTVLIKLSTYKYFVGYTTPTQGYGLVISIDPLTWDVSIVSAAQALSTPGEILHLVGESCASGRVILWWSRDSGNAVVRSFSVVESTGVITALGSEVPYYSPVTSASLYFNTSAKISDTEFFNFWFSGEDTKVYGQVFSVGGVGGVSLLGTKSEVVSSPGYDLDAVIYGSDKDNIILNFRAGLSGNLQTFKRNSDDSISQLSPERVVVYDVRGSKGELVAIGDGYLSMVWAGGSSTDGYIQGVRVQDDGEVILNQII